MSAISSRPKIILGEWVVVGGVDCVISNIYEKDSQFGSCEVVFNADKPTTHDVTWDGQKWVFPNRSDFGGYADKTDPYVAILKRGKI